MKFAESGTIFFGISYCNEDRSLYACGKREKERKVKRKRTAEISNRDDPSLRCLREPTENLHLRILKDAEGSGGGPAFRRLFLFSSNFLGGAERKVALKGITTLYRSAYFAQLVNGISSSL